MPIRSVFPALLATLLLLAGCGGGGGGGGSSQDGGSPSSGGGTTTPAANGTAKVSIVWPAREASRFMPVAASSVVVTLSLEGVQVARQVLVRPSDSTSNATATFTGLAYGTYGMALAAYPNDDGTGVAQATGASNVKVLKGVPGVADVSLVTTIASLSILPVSLDKNGAATLSVGATDARGATVLLGVGSASESVTWSADKVANSLGAMVDAVTLSSTTGSTVTLTGVHSGTTQVHATLDLGLQAPLTVTGSVTVNAIADGTGTVTFS